MANPTSSSTLVIEKSFQDSLNKFKSRLTNDERSQFQFTTLEDLRQAAGKIQAEQAARSAAMHLPRIKGFLEAFTQFGTVIEVFLNASEFVAFIWGPMKFLLQTASCFANAFDTLLNAYEQIGEVLPLIGEYRELFNGNSHFDQALAAIYGDVLEFHRRALRVFTTPVWKQVFRSVWKDFESRFRHILDNIRSHRELIQSHASAIHFSQSRNDRTAALESLERLEAEQLLVKHTNFIRWLVEGHSTLDHETACDAREEYPNSGSWLLRNQQYKEWRSHASGPPLFWLHGIPGAGKTVLASIIIEDCKDDKVATTAYFYCKDSDPRKTTFVGVLSALLCQLVHRDHELLTWCCDEQSKSGQISLKSPKLSKELTKMVLSVQQQKIYLVIDGIDECGHCERDQILRFIEEISNGSTGQVPLNIRVMVTSQDENDIRKRLATASELHIRPAHTKVDIHNFVEHGCRKLRYCFELDDAECQYICDLITDRSKGMFLFAKLIITSLGMQVNREAFLKQVDPNEFPDGLQQAYLLKIGFVNKELTEWNLASLCLRYLTFPCFDDEVDQPILSEDLKRGCFIFQDYAATHWVDHVGFIAHGNQNSRSDATLSSAEEAFNSAMPEFVMNYGIHELEIRDEECHKVAEYKTLEHLVCYDDLQSIMHVIESKRARGLEGMDEVVPARLSLVLDRNRKVLENLAKVKPADVSLERVLQEIYGTKWFKCPKAACFYFHEGFIDKKTRDGHIYLHENHFGALSTIANTLKG